MAPPRVFGYIAAEADVAVLIVRRSKYLNLMVRWDLSNDTFTVGQWLSRQIDMERSALSPDGRIFGYYALNNERQPSEGPHPGHYIVLCRPPFFSALALWWTGGKQADRVMWKGKHELSVGKQAGTPPDKGQMPDNYRVSDPQDVWNSTYVSPYDVDRIERMGLKIRGNPALEPTFARTYPWLDWSEVDHRRRLLLARDGRIYVRESKVERELFDLNPYEFEAIAPPSWATEWPD